MRRYPAIMPRKTPTYTSAKVPMTLFDTAALNYTKTTFVSTNPIRKRHGMYAALGSLSTTPHRLAKFGVAPLGTKDHLRFDVLFENGDRLVDVHVLGDDRLIDVHALGGKVPVKAGYTLSNRVPLASMPILNQTLLETTDLDALIEWTMVDDALLSAHNVQVPWKRSDLQWMMLTQIANEYVFETSLYRVVFPAVSAVADDVIPSILAGTITSKLLPERYQHVCTGSLFVRSSG